MLWSMAGKKDEQKGEEVGENKEGGKKEAGGMREEWEKNSVEQRCDNRKTGEWE